MPNRSSLIHSLTGLSVLILLLLLCACVHSPRTGPSRFIDPDLPANQYAGEIKKQKKILVKEKDTARHATAYYNLALLYLSYRNPAKDYQAAQQYLKKSAALDKSITGNYESQNMLNLLDEISSSKTDFNALNDKALKSNKKYQKCTKDNIRLIQENVDLKLSIERLKNLDLEIEQKRKTFK